jgi:hypothetical protein
MSRVWERGSIGKEYFPLVPSVKEMDRKNTTPDK